MPAERASDKLRYGICDCEYPCSCVEFEGARYGSWKAVLDAVAEQRDALSPSSEWCCRSLCALPAGHSGACMSEAALQARARQAAMGEVAPGEFLSVAANKAASALPRQGDEAERWERVARERAIECVNRALCDARTMAEVDSPDARRRNAVAIYDLLFERASRSGGEG